MNHILIIGAGRSANACIQYLLKAAAEHAWSVTVADADLATATRKVGNHPNGQAAYLDASNAQERQSLISRADVVISLLPPHMHVEVAHDCIQLKKHLITASYVAKEIQELDDEFRKNGLAFLGEMGLDPGIDHMSAMQKIDEIKSKGGTITAFSSNAGGLIAPEDLEGNPWRYKFTWNPRNVVKAGQGTAQFLENGKYKYVPYNRLFKDYKLIEIPGYEEPFEVYANRDSLHYREVYGLDGIPSLARGTIRYRGYCDAWNALLQIGLTDSTYTIMDSDKITYLDLMESFLNKQGAQGASVKERMAEMLGEPISSPVMDKLEWLGLFSADRIGLADASPALILEELLLKKWKLAPNDKDLILMQHEFEYEISGKKSHLTSTMALKGIDAEDTAMSRLVGLPMAIFAKFLMTKRISITGVNIPVTKEIYEPVLEELKAYGVIFHEKEMALTS